MESERLKDLLMRFGPWGTFVMSVALAFWLAAPSRSPGGIFGFAEGDTIALAPMEPARIVEIAVQVGQDVTAGQVVASMDTSPIDVELDVQKAKHAELLAKISAGGTGAIRDTSTDLADLEATLEKTRLSLSREEGALERAKLELDALAKEKSRIDALMGQGLATRDDRARVALAHSVAERSVGDHTATIELLRSQLEAATLRRERYAAAGDAGVEVEPIRRQLDVVERRIAWLEHRRAGAQLRTPTAGRITAVHRRPGETAAADTPVVSMVRAQIDRVVACVPERDALSIRAGDRAKLWNREGNTRVVGGSVVALGPTVEELPERCQTSRFVRTWGRTAMVLLDEPSPSVPGQAFEVSFSPGEPGEGSGSAVASLGDENPRPMTVPEELTRRSRFEPSGVVWSPELLRYLIVSDDTGEPDRLEHAPWLFTMTVDGRVDPNPLTVTGARELNDLESIAKDSDGTLFLLSSQSYSKRGNRPASRTAFLEIRNGDGVLSVRSQLHLAEALDEAPPELLERLGIPRGTRDLEIEGIALRGGALYFGLKSPLDEQRRALVWRLPDARRQLDSGALDLARLELWAKIALQGEIDGRTVPAGVSDLLFLPDGTLLVAATPARDEGTIETGRIVFVKDPQPGVLQASVLREFPGLRPEGLAVAPTPGRFVVVFDTGEAPPQWAELSWPD